VVVDIGVPAGAAGSVVRIAAGLVVRANMAFAVAAVLAYLALHLTHLPERLRGQVLATCR